MNAIDVAMPTAIVTRWLRGRADSKICLQEWLCLVANVAADPELVASIEVSS
ncbi:MAG TPA: hypothetical protein VGU63_16035 [Candidatus Acidoferrales bacterium]|nr:hypothetical protein [Candidatus Acidoferrales bacterium]